jgi:acyl-CoA thioesterase
MAALALSATREHLDDVRLVPRTATVAFPSSIDTDEVEVRTDVVRLGKNVVQTRAEVRDWGRSDTSDDIRLDVIAAFGRDRGGDVSYVDLSRPDVPDPGNAEPEGSPFGKARPSMMPPVFERLDRRKALGALPWDDDWRPGAPARVCRWLRFREPALHQGRFDPLALLVAADLPGPAVWTKLGPDNFHTMSSVQMTVHFLGIPESADAWLLADYRSGWAGEGYCTTETHLWDENGRFLAACSQLMTMHEVAPGWFGPDLRPG